MRPTCDKLQGSESKEDSDGEEAIVSFMAMNDNKDEGSDVEVNDSNLSQGELVCAFEEIHEDIEKLLKKNISLKDECTIFSKKYEE